MKIYFAIVAKNINTKNNQDVINNIKSSLAFETNVYISEKALDIIIEIVKNHFIKENILTDNDKLIKKILEHNDNSNIPSISEISNIESILYKYKILEQQQNIIKMQNNPQLN